MNCPMHEMWYTIDINKKVAYRGMIYPVGGY